MPEISGECVLNREVYIKLTGYLTYVQCVNPSCKAIGCRTTKSYLEGVTCKLCHTKMIEIKWNDYEYKLHYTNTIHEEGLLPNRLGDYK